MELAQHTAEMARDVQHRQHVEAAATEHARQRSQPVVFENEKRSVGVTNQIAWARDSGHEQATQEGELPLQGVAVKPVRWQPFWRLDENRLLIALPAGPVHNVGSVTDELLEDVITWDVHGLRPDRLGRARAILADMPGRAAFRIGEDRER
ncbi:MAG: hypothetical protein DMF96_03955 [Acidobacteria bacterium]|nr:MAG: hypothetical protein DMF96_03955 [Acidobacteriota bacterium]